MSTGISAIASRNPFTISPNPVKQWIHIYHKEDFTYGRSFHATLFNSQGQLVFEREMQAGEYSIPITELSIGVYVLQLKTKAGVFSERVMKVESE